LPLVYGRTPLVEFPVTAATDKGSIDMITGKLWLHAENKHPVQLEMISTLSPPEQWQEQPGMVRRLASNTTSALMALSQLELAQGSVSITGLDLTRHQVLFERKDLRSLKWTELLDAFRKADSELISLDALEGRKSNAAFFRDFLNQRLLSESDAGGASTSLSSEKPVRVFIVVTGSLLFERGSDLKPLQFEGNCHCRIYHLRFHVNRYDVSDELGNLMKLIQPKTFDLTTPVDFRRAIAQILADLQSI